ncbi:hypothetical protein ACFL6U_17810 [Planctomycetota bacterium]
MHKPNFPHLNLIQKDRGDAKLSGGGKSNPQVKHNKENRQSHSQFLHEKFNAFSLHAQTLTQQREQDQLPAIKGGVPFMLQIPDEEDGVIEFLAEKLGLEVVAEYADGYLIVATQDLDLSHVIKTAGDFSGRVRGSGQMAHILDVDEDPLSDNRIHRLLDDRLLEQWPFPDDQEYLLDVSIESAAFGLPKKPRITKRTKPSVKAKKEAAYAETLTGVVLCGEVFSRGIRRDSQGDSQGQPLKTKKPTKRKQKQYTNCRYCSMLVVFFYRLLRFLFWRWAFRILRVFFFALLEGISLIWLLGSGLNNPHVSA